MRITPSMISVRKITIPPSVRLLQNALRASGA
jgi:hypothetical protein